MKALPQVVREKNVRFARLYRRAIQWKGDLSTIGKEHGIGMFAHSLVIDLNTQIRFGGNQGVQMATWNVRIRILAAPAKAGSRSNESAEEGPVSIMTVEGPGHRPATQLNRVTEICAVHI
ncbi:MAG: hypothetical protein OXF32_12320 [Anaerolineaceae bacterium]|nr:hypothetical protein [Anaerolineaceae bacterium]